MAICLELLNFVGMTELGQFRAMADKHGICEMAREWDACKSKKQLMDLALSIRGIQYLWKSMGEGWGLSSDYIYTEFKPFINRGVVRSQGGYTSSIHCKPTLNDNMGMIVNETATLIIDMKEGNIVVPENHICEIYLVDCDVSVFATQGKAIVYTARSTVRAKTPNIKIIRLEEYGHV